MIQAVIFDLDGVITDTATHHFKAWRKLAKELGIILTTDDNESLKGLDRLSSLEKILQKGNIQKISAEKIRLAEQKNRYYQSYIASMSKKDIFTGAEVLLKTLQQKKILIGLASASKNAHAVVKRLEIEHYFDYIADAGQIKNSKPHPEIFLTVADNLKVKPQYCLGVEDAQAGIHALKAAGMKAIGIGDKESLSEADFLFNTLVEMNIESILNV